ncbi:hypothetical protein [Streptomyces sp. NPDC127108]|uniref:hypothetical protein n=1 Tax=Streptomyces sp. NPDC127108 TaxID=3345361 RepID=UPI003642136A
MTTAHGLSGDRPDSAVPSRFRLAHVARMRPGGLAAASGRARGPEAEKDPGPSG